MQSGTVLLRRGNLRASTILSIFPSPVAYADRTPGAYSFSGAYLLSRGRCGDDESDYTVHFPQTFDVSAQLLSDNPLLALPAYELLQHYLGREKILLADSFAETLQNAEDARQLRLACRLFDYAVFLPRNRGQMFDRSISFLRHARKISIHY
jgi:hypothetical protein